MAFFKKDNSSQYELETGSQFIQVSTGDFLFQEREKTGSSLNQVASDLKQNHVTIFAIWGYKSQSFLKKGKIPILEFSQFSYLKFEQLDMSPVKTYSEATS